MQIMCILRAFFVLIFFLNELLKLNNWINYALVTFMFVTNTIIKKLNFSFFVNHFSYTAQILIKDINVQDNNSLCQNLLMKLYLFSYLQSLHQ